MDANHGLIKKMCPPSLKYPPLLPIPLLNPLQVQDHEPEN